MAVKYFAHDIHLGNVGQLQGARLHNVTNAQMLEIATGLGPANAGLKFWNTDEQQEFTWTGTAFRANQYDIGGSVIFRGVVDASMDISTQVEAVSGYEYTVVGAGVAPQLLPVDGGLVVTFHGNVNMDGNIELAVGDRILFVGGTADVSGTQSTVATDAYVVGKGGAAGGLIAAPQTEVTAGVGNAAAVTAETLAGALVANKYVRQYVGTHMIEANTPFALAHNLSLADPAGFTITVTAEGMEVSLQVNPVDANTVELLSHFPMAAATVVVQGASNSFAA